MPTYDYHCTKCENEFSVKTTIEKHVKEKAKCPKCGSAEVKPLFKRFFAKTSRKS